MATYYVAKTGNNGNPGTLVSPKLTIAAGVGLMSSGDTLYIREGTYLERISPTYMTVPSGGGEGSRTVISGYPGETVWLAPTSQEQRAIIEAIAVSYVTYQDMHLDATSTTTGTSGAAVNNNASYTRFLRLEIINANSDNGVNGGSAPGMLIGGNFTEIQYCNIHHNGFNSSPFRGGYAIYLAGANCLIEHCDLHDNKGYGLQQYASGHDDRDNNVMRYNRIYNNSLTGDDEGGVVMGSGHNNQFYGNIVYNNGGIGVTLYPFQPTADSKVYNNTIYGNWQVGISNTGLAVGSIVKNNIVYGNNNGGAQIDNTGSGAVFSNNLLTNPQFTNAAGADFTLTPFSSAINAGTVNIASGITITDFFGSAPDIGALEFEEDTPFNLQVGFTIAAKTAIVTSPRGTTKIFSIPAKTLIDLHAAFNSFPIFEGGNTSASATGALTFGTPKQGLHIAITL